MYGFILNMWVMNRIDADQVNSFVGKFITQAQATEIMSQQQVNLNNII